MMNSFTVRLLWSCLNWLARLIIVIAMLLAIMVIALRYWLLPGIEQYHNSITSALSAAIGNPVSIGSIQGDWEGVRPRLEFDDVRILNEQRNPSLVLPRIDGSVSWITLFAGQLRFASLEIDRPELFVQRDVQGKVRVGGVALESSGSDNSLADWLLHQSHIVVRDASITWVDELRDATPLVLKKVNLRIENTFRHHRVALRAVPPAELASPLDLRGDFHGATFDDPQAWHGQLYTELDVKDVASWRHWLDLPRQISAGRGAVRCWMGLEKGKLTGITSDLALFNTTARLADDAADMQLNTLKGRLVWRQEQRGFAVSTQGLMLHLQDGLELQPTDFYLRYLAADNGQPADTEIRTNALRLETITRLVNYLPLGATTRARLEAYTPSGKVSALDARWQGSIDKPISYRIKGRFEDIAVRKVDDNPGFSGLTFDVDGSDVNGKVSISSRQMQLDAPAVLREPWSFDTMSGQVTWRHQDGQLEIKADKVIVINDDLAGTVQGSYSKPVGASGVLDLQVDLTRGKVRRATRYTPLIALSRSGGDWVSAALLAGHSEDFHLRLFGKLSDFPPDASNKVQFEIGAHVRNAALEISRDWPRIENIAGEFRIRGNRMEVDASSATMAGAYLQNISVDIPEMNSASPVLEVNGEASAPANTFLKFIQVSPVRGYIAGFTDGMRASGNASLNLLLKIPLAGASPVKVAGKVYVKNNDIDLGKGVPWLRNTRGVLSFDESGMQAKEINAEILGGPAAVSLRTDNGKVHVDARGSCNLDTLRRRESSSWLDYLSGTASWKADVDVTGNLARFEVDSDLKGIESSLPQPFSKDANESLPVHIASHPIDSGGANGGREFALQLGDLVRANLVSDKQDGDSIIRKGFVIFGTKGKMPSPKRMPRSGIWLSGSLPQLSVQGWGGIAGSSGKSVTGLALAGGNLRIGKLTGFGKQIDEFRVTLSKRRDGMTAQMSGTGLNGVVSWLPHGYMSSGKLTAKIGMLHLQQDDSNSGKDAKPAASSPAAADDKTGFVPADVPALEVSVDNLILREKPVGRFELVGYPDGEDWHLRRLNISNPDGSLVGDGAWLDSAKPQTQLNLQLEIGDAGRILDRSGYPNTVKNGSGKLNAKLVWSGRPDQFAYATLNGSVHVDAGKGRFLKMDPGAGKLLSILSMQALPKRFTLDFNDVFSQGFQFDNIVGDAAIRDGVMNTDEFHVYGSSAKVALRGSVDLNHETQNLNVKVFPAIGDSVSLLALFAVNPAVGIGSLIANTVLGSPLDKLVSFEYNITGTWSEPSVTRVGGEPKTSGEFKPNE